MQAALYLLSKCVMCPVVLHWFSMCVLLCFLSNEQSLVLKNTHIHMHSERGRKRREEKREREHTKGDPLIISLPAPVV